MHTARKPTHTITRAKFDALPRDYRMTRPDGTHAMLVLTDRGTCLAEVTVTD